MAEKHLYAIVLRLVALRLGALPANHGDQARAALLNLIRKGDSPLAKQLHDANTAKPYSISLINGGKRDKHGAHHFGKGDEAEWRFSLMMQPAFEALLKKYLMDNQAPHVRIGAINFAIVDVFVTNDAHHDSATIRIQDLTEGWHHHPEDQLPRRIVLDFQSPTAFSLGQDKQTKKYRFHTQPSAKMLFSSLRKRWVKLGGVDAGDEFDAWVDAYIEDDILDLHLQKITVKKRSISGFVGQVAFQHCGDDRSYLRYWNLLSDLTFWTGIGYQTTRGMGQVRRLLMSD
ncbi:MAG: hypothetical protein Phog2KO_32900 [Phototrophicaceae bacterium]